MDFEITKIIQWIKKCIINRKTILVIIKDKDNRKYTLRWILSLYDDYLYVAKQPWIVFSAIDFLGTLNLEGKKVFEYGSGGSTLFWLSKGCDVVSVEHDPKWFQRMTSLITQKTQIDYELIEPESLPADKLQTSDPANPDHYVTSFDIPKKFFKKYVCLIDQFEKNSFDIVLIDGRCRPSCIKHAINKVKKSGYIVIDNADRDYYFSQTSKYLDNFEKFEFFSIGPGSIDRWKTDIYRKMT